MTSIAVSGSGLSARESRSNLTDEADDDEANIPDYVDVSRVEDQLLVAKSGHDGHESVGDKAGVILVCLDSSGV